MARVRPGRHAGRLTLAALLVALPIHGAAAQEWSVHAGVGGAYNLSLPLTIEQTGAPDLSLTGHYDTRAFDTPLYYVLRVERAYGNGALALELIHHKLFLTNPPDEVQDFSISHGFNVVTLQRAWSRAGVVSLRAGAGVVVAHPETTVRGQKQPGGGWLDRGYYVSGPAAQVAFGISRPLRGRWRVGGEGKLVGARAWVPIADGTARLWHASAHLNALVGARF